MLPFNNEDTLNQFLTNVQILPHKKKLILQPKLFITIQVPLSSSSPRQFRPHSTRGCSATFLSRSPHRYGCNIEGVRKKKRPTIRLGEHVFQQIKIISPIITILAIEK